MNGQMSLLNDRELIPVEALKGFAEDGSEEEQGHCRWPYLRQPPAPGPALAPTTPVRSADAAGHSPGSELVAAYERGEEDGWM